MTYNNEDLERESWSFMTGLLVGTAIGATAALLMAPKRGSELRDDLTSTATNVRDQVSTKVSSLKKTAEDMAERDGKWPQTRAGAQQTARRSPSRSAMFDPLGAQRTRPRLAASSRVVRRRNVRGASPADESPAAQCLRRGTLRRRSATAESSLVCLV